jgi:ABC-type transporter Mla MlaB component
VFRVEKQIDGPKTRIVISGEISSACVEVAEVHCEQAIRSSKAVDLVLDVTSIDDSGLALLRRLAAKGVRLVAQGVYHSWLVETIRGAKNDDSKPVY